MQKGMLLLKQDSDKRCHVLILLLIVCCWVGSRQSSITAIPPIACTIWANIVKHIQNYISSNNQSHAGEQRGNCNRQQFEKIVLFSYIALQSDQYDVQCWSSRWCACITAQGRSCSWYSHRSCSDWWYDIFMLFSLSRSDTIMSYLPLFLCVAAYYRHCGYISWVSHKNLKKYNLVIIKQQSYRTGSMWAPVERAESSLFSNSNVSSSEPALNIIWIILQNYIRE